jgi:hypothetical protein
MDVSLSVSQTRTDSGVLIVPDNEKSAQAGSLEQLKAILAELESEPADLQGLTAQNWRRTGRRRVLGLATPKDTSQQ